MTNLERIRKMSDVELAELLSDCFNGGIDWLYEEVGKMQDPHAKEVYDDLDYDDTEVIRTWLTCK